MLHPIRSEQAVYEGIDKAIQQSVRLYGGVASPEGGLQKGSEDPQGTVVGEEDKESRKSSSPQSERSDSLTLPTSVPDSEVLDDDYQSMLSRAAAGMVLPDDDEDNEEIVYREVAG